MQKYGVGSGVDCSKHTAGEGLVSARNVKEGVTEQRAREWWWEKTQRVGKCRLHVHWFIGNGKEFEFYSNFDGKPPFLSVQCCIPRI